MDVAQFIYHAPVESDTWDCFQFGKIIKLHEIVTHIGFGFCLVF